MVDGRAEIDAMSFRVAGRWPERPLPDPVLRAKARELAEVMLAENRTPTADGPR